MITIFNGRQLSLDGAQDVVYAQVSVALRDKIHLFNTGRNCNPFAVFMALALHADKDGWSWPGRDKLSQETGIKNAIGASIKHLCDMRVDGHRVLACWRERRTDGQWSRTLYRIFPDAWTEALDWPARFDAQGDMYSWDPNAGQPGPHKPPLDKQGPAYIPPKDPHVFEVEPDPKKEPPSADPSPVISSADDVAEIEALFGKAEERQGHTVEECREGVRKAIERFSQNGGRPGVADPTQDHSGWKDKRLIAAFCAVSKQPLGTVKPSSLRDWPDQFAEWASTWEDAAPTPQEAYECMMGITQSEKDWKDFETPRQPSFRSTMDIMLARLRAGEPWDATGRVAGQRKDGSSGPRQEPPIAADTIVLG